MRRMLKMNEIIAGTEKEAGMWHSLIEKWQEIWYSAYLAMSRKSRYKVLISELASQPTQGGVSPAKLWLDTPWVKPEVSLMTYRAWHLPASLELVAKLPHNPSPPRQWCHTGTGLPTAPHAACPWNLWNPHWVCTLIQFKLKVAQTWHC